MLTVDLTLPIVILSVAIAIVMLARAYASWAERKLEARTDAFLREQGLIPGPEAGEVKRGSREDEGADVLGEASEDDLAEGSSHGEGPQA